MDMNRRQFVVFIAAVYFGPVAVDPFKNLLNSGNTRLACYDTKPGRIIDVGLAMTGHGTGTISIGVELIKAPKFNGIHHA